MIDRSRIQRWSKLCLVVGGVLILVGGLAGALVVNDATHDAATGILHTAALDGRAWMMPFWMVVVGVFASRLVLLSAFHVHAKRQVALWGGAAIAVGLLSLLVVGGFVVGALAAIGGGALALVAGRAAQAP